MYDILVVGCGPAGASLALLAAKEGFKVLVVERKRGIEEPTICGEFLPDFSLISRAFPEDFHLATEFLRKAFYSDEVTVNEIEHVLIDLCGRRKILDVKGKVISRKKAVSKLIEEARSLGAEVLLSTKYVGSKISGDEITSLLKGRKKILERSSIVVGADGFPSRVSRVFRLNNTVEKEDLACASVQLARGEHPEDLVYMGFHKRLSPGGYNWVIPRGDQTLSVGVGVRISYGADLRGCHLQFLKERKLRGFTQIYGKLLPVGGIFRNLANNFSMLIGDAAGLVMPVNGGGIPTAVVSSFIAAMSLKEWFDEPQKASTSFRNSMLSCFEGTFEVALRARKIADFLMKHELFPLLWAIPSSVLRGVIALDRSSIGYKLLNF